MKNHVAIGIKVHKFALSSREDDSLHMATELDEFDPSADLEFWEAFKTGEYYMTYLGEAYELEPPPNTDRFVTMYYMETGTRRAAILINNGMETEYLVTCVENNRLHAWRLTDDYDTARQFGEDFVMRRDLGESDD